MASNIMLVRCKLVDVANIIRGGREDQADHARKLIREVQALHKAGAPLSDSQLERVAYYSTTFGMDKKERVTVPSEPDLPADPS